MNDRGGERVRGERVRERRERREILIKKLLNLIKKIKKRL